MVDVNIRQTNGIKLLFDLLLLAILGSNSQMAPVAAGNSKILEYGSGQVYSYETTVTLNEPAEGKGKDVGYQILADVSVTVLWQSQDKQNKLLEFELNNPRLLIKSRKAPTPEGFVIHSSNLESLANSPYVVNWISGRINEIYVDTKEDLSMVNIKRGISSLFQFQLLDMETKETDASGNCLVAYKTLDPYSFTKTKTDCKVSDDVPYLRPGDPVLSGSVNSSRVSTYVLSEDLSYIKSLSARESHELRVSIKRDVGGSVSALQELTYKDTKVNVDVLKSKNMGEALKEFEKSRKVTLTRRHLHSEVYEPNCEKEECPSFPKLIKENRDNLSSCNMGTLQSATAFFKVLSAAKSASKEDLTKAFKGRRNKEILGQLCDLAGAIQTRESHEIITNNILNIESGTDLENTERYLWSLSIGSHPNEYILKDIFMRCKSMISDEKLSETMLLTLASMANKYHHVPGADQTLTKEITEFIINGLESCTDDDCKCKYLRALKNIKCPRTIKNLMKYALEGKRKVSVGAMKALRSFDSVHWSEEVIDTAQRIYFQVGKKFDSSSRTLAVDIILESKPSREIIQEMVLSLARRDKAFEVKMYLLQRIKQISEKCPEFASVVNSTIAEFGELFNNYNVKAQRGLTTAFTRSVARSDYRNVSLVSIQEIHSGFLKRGLVDVAVETPEKTTTLFTLGLFAGGLSSFVSSSDKQEEQEEDETVTAGMELTVLGTQLRPFVFFKGQGELMGHVWSGTASDRTPAYQAFIVTEDQLEHISLQNGLMSRLQLLGVVSFDLSGQVQMSLWKRNAHSLVEKSAGMFLQGRISVDTSFVRSKVEINLATEVKLNLVSDLNFYNDISLCMQLSQPESLIRHNIHKVERIPGSKHRLRKSKYKKISVPGRTYALNRKNNEMCNLIFRHK